MWQRMYAMEKIMQFILTMNTFNMIFFIGVLYYLTLLDQSLMRLLLNPLPPDSLFLPQCVQLCLCRSTTSPHICCAVI